MKSPSILFSVATFPQSDDDYFQENIDNIAGLAEWFDADPALFLLLLGSNAQPCHFAIYGDSDPDTALAAPMVGVKQRWQDFYALALHTKPEIASQLARIDTLIRTNQHGFLVHDTSYFLSEKTHTQKQWQEHTIRRLKQANDLEIALNDSTTAQITTPILEIIHNHTKAFGYWDGKVIAHKHDINIQALSGNPLLKDTYQSYSEYGSWVDELKAHIVIRKNAERHTNTPCGLVTAYGRWIIPLEAGFTYIDEHRIATTGWVSAARFVKELDDQTTQYDSQLFDVNGLAASPLLVKGFISTLAKSIGTTQRRISRDQTEIHLVRLPSLDILVADLEFPPNEPKDGFIRYKKTKTAAVQDGQLDERLGTYMGLCDLKGLSILPADEYHDIFPFHPGKKIAVSEIHHLDLSLPKHYDQTVKKRGLINDHGVNLIPCEYQFILPLAHPSPPKIFQKNRIVAIDFEMRVSIYKVTGELVVASPYTVLYNMLSAGKAVQNDQIVVSDGEWLHTMDFDGNLLASKVYRVATFMHEYQQAREQSNQTQLERYCCFSPAQVLAAKPQGPLKLLCKYLTLGNAQLADLVYEAVMAELHQSGELTVEIKLPETSSPLACLLDKTLHALLRVGREQGELFVTFFDWNESLERLSELDSWLTIEAVDGFTWSANKNGDTFEEGLTKARKYAQLRGVDLYLLDGDDYILGAVDSSDKIALIDLTASLGIQLKFD